MIRAVAIALLAATALRAQSIEGFKVYDKPGDAGGAIIAEWKPVKGESRDTVYVVSVSESQDGPFAEIERFPAQALVEVKTPRDTKEVRTVGKHVKSEAPELFGHFGDVETEHFIELEGIVPPPGGPWLGTGRSLPTWVKIEAITPAGSVATAPLAAAAAPNWWTWHKTNNFLFLLLFGSATFLLIARARKHPDVFVRRIPGLDAMEEAIGRATEMGRPIIYLNGLYGMDNISTIASVSILGQVSKRVASYDTQLLVPATDPIVLSVSQEVVREGFTAAGRPDKYREQDVWFITSEQFSYVASVDGIMLREKPAACLYMGYYFAESLLLAETGASTGAIQIAGTDSITQLPFFIACCDYTLMGEELYAASAYLSREPLQLGSLRSQDVGKAFIFLTVLLGTFLGALGVPILAWMLASY